MEQLNFNTMKNPKNNLYQQNRVANYINKNHTKINHYSIHSKQENKNNLKNLNIYNNNSESNNQNNEVLENETKHLTNNYSYPSRKMNSTRGNSTKNSNNILQQYTSKDNLQSKYYLNYLQRQRNTFDIKEKNMKNIFYSDIQRLNSSNIKDYIDNQKNINKNVKNNINNNNNVSYENNLLSNRLNKLNSSKSTNDFFTREDNDISIEYNNAPIIQTKRNNNNNYLNSYRNNKIDYIYQNTNFKNKTNLNNNKNNYVNYESYISSSINKNKNLFLDKYLDINISNINNEQKMISYDKKNNYNYNYLLNQKKQILEKQNTNSNLNKKEIKSFNKNNYNNNPSLDKYKIESNNNNNIYPYNLSSNSSNYNLNKKNKKIYNSNLKTIKSGDVEMIKNQNIQKKNNNNNKLINISNQKITDLNNNNKKNKNYKNNSIKPELKKFNQSKKDIFSNKEYQTMLKKNHSPPKKIKSNSPESKENLNINKYESNKNNRLLPVKNISKKDINKNYNIDDNKQNNDSKIEILEVEYFNKNNNKDKIENKKNLSNRQKILIFKKDKNNYICDGYNSVNRNNKDVLNFQYKLNYNTENLKNPIEKKSSLTEYYNSEENNIDSKNKTSRHNDLKINQNLIFPTEILGNDYFNINKFENKSSKNIAKKENRMLNNLISERKKITSNSPPPNNILQYNINDNKNKNNINNNYNLKNININENNSKYDYKPYQNNISRLLTNQKEEKKNTDKISKTESNINNYANTNEFLKKDNKKNVINKNNNDNSNLLKRINFNKQLNSNPVKLYLRKKELNNKVDIFKTNKVNNNNIYINNYLKQINLSNKNTYESINRIKKYNSVANHNKTNNNLNNKNNNIININNNTSNVNVLNVKNSSINICIEKNNILSPPQKNINYITPSHSKENKNKRNIINLKNTANELFEKNKNLKNISVFKPIINKGNTNYINPDNDSSYLKISTNTIRYNNNSNIDKTENIFNAKSYKNILIKSNNSDNNYMNNNKKLIPNHSEVYIVNKKSLNTDSSNINIINNRNKNKVYLNKLDYYKNNLKTKDIKYNELKINNTDSNRAIIKQVKSPNHLNNNININNYYKKNNTPIISPNNSIQFNLQNNNKNNSPKGVYIKPYRILSMSKPKKLMKSKSELKINNNNKNESENENFLIYSLKTSQNLNPIIYFNTSPTFYQKDEYFKSNNGSIKKNSTRSLNTSIITKNISSYNNPDNENNISYENINNWKNSIIMNSNIRDTYTKSYCFFYKICNYYIKPPKIEKCYFIKNDIKYNNNKFRKSIQNKNNILENNHKMSMFQDIVNINDDEKNNESSQNGLIMTFGEMNNNNNKKYNEKSYALINSNSKVNYHNIVSNIDNNMEDSDLDIYKSLQPSSKNNNKNDKLSNEYSSSNLNISENEDLKIYESLEKDISIDKNFKSQKYKSTDGKEINEDFEEKKSKTFKKSHKCNLENAEKGLKILGKIALRRGIKSNDETLDNIDNSRHIEENIKNIFLGTNKLNELFNSRKETDSTNSKKNEDEIYNQKTRLKYSNSVVNKDFIQGISKIKNILDKNNINNFDIKLNENKINTYDAKNKINYDSNSNTNEYNDNNDYSEILKTKIKTNGPKSRTNLGSSNDINTFDSYIDIINNNNIEINPRYKESEILINKHKTESRPSNDIITKDSKDSLLPIKCNLLNDEIFNHCNDLLSYSEEDLKSNIYYNYNYKINIKEFESYLKIIKKKQSNKIKHDIIYLLNILVENNYSYILDEITKIILYKNDDKNEINNLNKNEDIIKNVNLFKNIIFVNISKGIKNIFLLAKICNDLNNNIYNELSDKKYMKNSKERNLKVLINDECLSIINNFKKIKEYNNNTENGDYYFLRKKIIGYAVFIYELINLELLKQQFGFFVLEQFYKLYKDNVLNNEIKLLYLEAITILINKLGKLVLLKNNNKLIQNIDNYIDNNLKNIINNENNITIPTHLKFKIMNIITKRDNKWDDISDKLEKEEKNKNLPLKIEQSNANYNKMSDKIWNKEINIDDVNKSIIEEDLVNYISYFTEENNKGQINIKNNIDKSYNWKIIEELVNNKNYGLEAIINYFISVCVNVVYDNNQLVISNDYIKNIIEYYVNNISKQAKDSIHNQMIKTFLNINEYVNKNQNMFKILGNLLYILIDNKLYHIKYFNHYLKLEKQAQINMAIITRYCIISSGKFAKKYLNDFKQTKLFHNNDIFIKYVSEPLKDLLYFIQ